MSRTTEKLRAPPPARPAARPVQLIVNAHAGSALGRRGLRHAADALRRAGAEPDVTVTADLDELAAAWRSAPERRAVLVGGDGTVHAAARLAGPRREVALIATGHANNVARSLGIPLGLEPAARLAVHGRARPIDLIEARGPAAGRRHVVVEGVSVGFLAQARVRYHGANSGDLLAGLEAGAAALARFHPMPVRVVSDSGEEELSLSQLFVANLPLYEFGLHVAPHADPCDARLDLVGIAAPTRAAVLGMLAHLRRGRGFPAGTVHAWRARAITIETHGRSPIVADSTDLGPGPVDLEPLPAALPIVRP